MSVTREYRLEAGIALKMANGNNNSDNDATLIFKKSCWDEIILFSLFSYQTREVRTVNTETQLVFFLIILKNRQKWYE